ncbi:hypothetical protein [Janthinobacterium sp.]|uniref:hypothetical protein n=1 Tax=Janthinobacterium sp. TaxID=1871054 RepID=UPI002898442B|nr:hypothetical protein [Janthinobacterium sp.]
MAWKQFPYPDDAYVHTPASLAAAWPRLHAGDAEPFPQQAALVQAWIAFHAGDFERAARLGLAVGVPGYCVAHKASCMYATHLELDEGARLALFEEVAERCERQQAEQPDNPAGYYWHAYSLGRYALGISVVKALAQGMGAKVRNSLNRTVTLAPLHADAHIAFGIYHAEIIDKVGAMIGGLSYGADKEDGYRHFRTALALNPASASARSEYARALQMLDGKKKLAEVMSLYAQAAECVALDAKERLEVEAAIDELKK